MLDRFGSKPRVMILSYVRGDTRRYRTLHLFEQLGLLGVNCSYAHLTDHISAELISAGYDLVVLQRIPFDRQVQSLIKLFEQHGSILLSDFDDLIFEVDVMKHIHSPDFSDPIRAQMYNNVLQEIRSTLDHSEGCLASTNYLAARIENSGKPSWVHRNAFSLEMLRISKDVTTTLRDKKKKPIVIGYASGTPTHNKDFEMIKPVLIKILKKYQHVILRIVGPLDPGIGWESIADRIERVSLVPWRKLPGILSGFDINLAPLVPGNPFTQSKSEIKWMEAAMVKVPTIASPTDAFQFAIRHTENGWLAENIEEWYEGICVLIEDVNLRSQIGMQAYEDAMVRYHPVTRSLELCKTMNEITHAFRQYDLFDEIPHEADVQKRASERLHTSPWMPARYEKDPSNLKLGWYTLRVRGMRIFLKSIWIYVRRLLAPLFPFRKNTHHNE